VAYFIYFNRRPLHPPLSGAANKNKQEFQMVFLRLPELEALGIRYSAQSLRRLEALGQFPKRVKMGLRRIAWRKVDIDQYIAGRTPKA
jgi:predicted DNA-binding transcriptional regulator AlpA